MFWRRRRQNILNSCISWNMFELFLMKSNVFFLLKPLMNFSHLIKFSSFPNPLKCLWHHVKVAVASSQSFSGSTLCKYRPHAKHNKYVMCKYFCKTNTTNLFHANISAKHNKYVSCPYFCKTQQICVMQIWRYGKCEWRCWWW